MRKAFTMVELIFVIVVLGILAAVAVPKMGSNKTNAEVAKARTDVASIRSSIMTERQSQLIKGINTFIDKLSADESLLFTGNGDGRELLTYGIVAGTSSGKWSKKADEEEYYFHVDSKSITFTYDNATGKLTCDRGDGSTDEQKICRKIVD